MSKTLAVKGMNDILPSSSGYWLYLEQIFIDWLNSYGYKNIRTPILEESSLFVRSIGENTDIVDKEMYSFVDSLNGDSLTLRPEGTAGVLRCAIEHNLLYNQTQKLWYLGPMFRHERPQKGRYRQFYQLGIEALGFRAPYIDTEIILMIEDLWRRLGVSNLELQINCLGNASERACHKQKLVSYLELHLEQLDKDSKNRLYKNPLRILDSKNPELREIIKGAPKLIDCLQEDSLNYYNTWKSSLDNLNINYVENPYLVRGLDYYNLAVFEWVSQDLGSQATVCAGGRYDPLFEQLGGKANSGIGLAIGIERLLLILEQLNKLPTLNRPDIYLINSDDSMVDLAFSIANELRVKSGFSIIQDFSSASLKAKLKKAHTVGAKFTIMITEEELALDRVIVKHMDSKTQEFVLLVNILKYLNSYVN